MFTKPFYIRRDMSAFARAVHEKKHVTIGFIGGSITDPRGRNRWSDYVVSQFIASHPDVVTDVENVAIGATGSDYAVFRVERDIVSRSCDIIFVEFAVNDRSTATELRNLSREGLLRKLLKGTNADIVLAYTYCGEMLDELLEGKLPDTIAEFERLAGYYGISSVFMGNYALDAVKRGLLRWEEWLPDGLHPENTGSRFYAKPVGALLTEALINPGTPRAGTEQAPLFPDNWENARTLPLENVERRGYWRLYRCLDRPLVERVLSSTAPGSSLRCRFSGTGVAVTVGFGRMSTDYLWRLDGGEWTASSDERPGWIDDYSWLRTKLLAAGLPRGEHILEMKLLPPHIGNGCTGGTFELCHIGILD